MIYLPDSARRVLHLTLTVGVSREFAAPWSRVGLDDPIPVADAVREQRFVWLGGQEDTARRYPRLGLVLPYGFALGAAPLDSPPGGAAPLDSPPGDMPPLDTAPGDMPPLDTAPGDTAAADRAASTGAGLVLLWPGSHEPHLSEQERQAVESGCRRLADILRRAADDGQPIQPAALPVVLQPLPPPTPGPAEAAAAMAFIRRLPGGNCALDLNGKITFITQEAADLLGAPLSDLLGSLPWEALPWMDTPTIEDHYRASVISRLPRTFVTTPPSGHSLRFALYPDDTGISVRITSGTDEPASPPPSPSTPTAAPSRAAALYHLMHLAATLTEAAHAQDVVEQAADQLVPALGAQAMALMVEDERRLRIVGYRGYPAELMARYDGEPVTSETATTHVLRTGTPLFFGDAGALLAAYPSVVIEDGMAAWAFLPLIASSRPVGSLVLAYARPRHFAPGERAVLTSIAGLIAQALDRARLYDSVHHLAHSLQTSLLPHALPHVPHLEVAARYLPAAQGLDIGGDFYDLIRIDETTVAAVIGDVQGHNVNAAVLMGQVRTAVHATAGAPPAEVLARTNRLLTDLEPGLFTSCLYAHIDLARHTACLATAGHPPPLLRHGDGTTDILDLPPGLLLGIDPDAGYTATEFAFGPPSLLALYTDGLVETPGQDIDEAIGEAAARITRAPHRQPLGLLADDLIHHARHAAPRTDDIALLLLRSREPGMPSG
ncbi:SpoIIE family protein phosphatase [Streptomyces sp. ISL-86]|uniref:SpoIIE family protein phosphatase n=1 Tax=Streptomyces sp. ISL-86 TaxID=2819187 RepID=UPI001BE73553|nr:SpoIIE family protein phosphatase [Streptomyces sp. ISL-86]MBT2459808.1 SpoIIE family protein phosphatase [Streptomyces sp. ISL-86]